MIGDETYGDETFATKRPGPLMSCGIGTFVGLLYEQDQKKSKNLCYKYYCFVAFSYIAGVKNDNDG